MAFDPGFSEADTIREFITPRLRAAGWDKPYSLAEQRTITDGRITTIAGKAKRGEPKRVDYLLRYSPDVSIAVVETKKVYATAADGLQQAKAYAQMLGLQFAYTSNGQELIEHDFLTGLQRTLKAFPSPDELWQRLTQGQQLSGNTERVLLEPSCRVEGKQPRYYQQIAINRALTALTSGQKRVLLTMATGTGKTYVAFQICWKLWSAGWNRQGAHRKPRILFLADRNILVDDPKDRTFTPFGDVRQQAIEEAQVLVTSSARSLIGNLAIEPSELRAWVDPERDGIQTGPFGAQLGSSDFIETGHPLITIGNVQNDGLHLAGLKYVSEEKAKLTLPQFNGGTNCPLD